MAAAPIRSAPPPKRGSICRTAPVTPLIENPESDPEWPRVKAADTLAAYIKCIEEERAGNREFSKAARETLHKLLSYQMEEVGAFLEDCLPSFSLTLDELD